MTAPRPCRASTRSPIDRTFVHAGDAVQVIVAASQCQCGGQRPECGTGIAEEKVGLPDRPAAVTAFDAESPAVCLLRQVDAQLLQGLQHAVGIVGLKHAMNQGLAGGEGGEQQHAVGNAFGAGQGNRAAQGGARGEIEEFHDEYRLRAQEGEASTACGASASRIVWHVKVR